MYTLPPDVLRSVQKQVDDLGLGTSGNVEEVAAMRTVDYDGEAPHVCYVSTSVSGIFEVPTLAVDSGAPHEDSVTTLRALVSLSASLHHRVTVLLVHAAREPPPRSHGALFSTYSAVQHTLRFDPVDPIYFEHAHRASTGSPASISPLSRPCIMRKSRTSQFFT